MMSNLKKRFEDIYGIELSITDVNKLNQVFSNKSDDEIEDESDYLKDIHDYIEHVYVEGECSDDLVRMLADIAQQEPESKMTAENVLVSDRDIKLSNGGYVVVK